MDKTADELEQAYRDSPQGKALLAVFEKSMLQAAERSDRFLSSDQIDSLITALRTRFEDGLRSASSDEITDFGAHWKLLRRGFPAQSCRDVILRAAE